MSKASNLLPDGVLVVNKPKGPSSAGCLNQVKRAIGIKKAGHAGTLDPMASGVLLLLLGQATKLSSYLMGRKIYSGTIELGRTTDTWDAEGETLETKEVDNITLLQVEQAVEEWVDQTNQDVPPYSAAKHQGQPLYKLSRQGLPTPKKTKAIKIFRAEMLAFEPPYIKFRVECSSGTYIRSLAHSLGIRLGKGATLTELTREYSHPFSIEQAVSVEELIAKPDLALGKAIALADALPDWPKAVLDRDSELAVKDGKSVPSPSHLVQGSHVLLVNENNSPLAIAENVEEADGNRLKILRGLWR